MILPHANGSVGGELLDAVGQLGTNALQGIAVCLVAGVTGIHLYRRKPKLPAGRSCPLGSLILVLITSSSFALQLSMDKGVHSALTAQISHPCCCLPFS